MGCQQVASLGVFDETFGRSWDETERGGLVSPVTPPIGCQVPLRLDHVLAYSFQAMVFI